MPGRHLIADCGISCPLVTGATRSARTETQPQSGASARLWGFGVLATSRSGRPRSGIRAALATALIIIPVASCGSQLREQPTVKLAVSQVPGYGDLDGVSCPSSTDCMAVGSSPAGMRHAAVAARWDGQHWRPVAVPASHTALHLTHLTRCE